MTPEEQALAKKRFFVITAIRISAAFFIAFGIIIAFGNNQWLGQGVRVPVGLGLTLIGLVDYIVIIPMLARRWRSRQDG